MNTFCHVQYFHPMLRWSGHCQALWILTITKDLRSSSHQYSVPGILSPTNTSRISRMGELQGQLSELLKMFCLTALYSHFMMCPLSHLQISYIFTQNLFFSIVNSVLMVKYNETMHSPWKQTVSTSTAIVINTTAMTSYVKTSIICSVKGVRTKILHYCFWEDGSKKKSSILWQNGHGRDANPVYPCLTVAHVRVQDIYISLAKKRKTLIQGKKETHFHVTLEAEHLQKDWRPSNAFSTTPLTSVETGTKTGGG